MFFFLITGISSCELKPENLLEQSDHEVVFSFDSVYLKIRVIDENIFNIRYHYVDVKIEDESLSCIAFTPVNIDWDIKNSVKYISLITDKTEIRINKKTTAVSFYSDEGKILLKEVDQLPRSMVPVSYGGDMAFSVKQYFILKEDEAIYGFGQHQQGIMNWRGYSVDLFQHNMEVAIPVMISSEGYGIFWDNYSLSRFEDGECTSFWSEVADGIDYYFIYGPEVDQIVSGIRKLTGQVPLFPKWAYGLIQSKARYTTQQEVINTVAEYRKRNVPLDVIVQDWLYWPDSWGAKEFDRNRYPDPVAMIDQLHNQYNVHILISVWPCLEPGSRDYTEMDSAGFLYPAEVRRYYDVYHPKARELYWEQAKRGLFDYGVDAWWADATEPEINGWETDIDDYKTMMKPSTGSAARYLNTYSLMQAKGLYEGQRSVTSDKRVFILTRSAFTGQQRYAASTWSGDVSASWEVFKNQIPAGLNFSITGIPYWTSDIGAFFINSHEWFRNGKFPEGVKDPAYHEFFVRWYQFGTFCPLFRVHGAQTPREIWYFGEPGDSAYDIQLKFDNLRYRLMPYIYSLAGMVTHEDYTIMRPLVMDFRYDSAVYDISDQYMFGPAIMACPVVQAGVDTRNVYLPEWEGGWFDFWTGIHFNGGQWISADAPFDIMPLFVRAGSIIPMGPFIQYAMEKTTDSIELRIYPGRDGEFILYEDEGDNYNYEKGAYCRIAFKWNERNQELKISDPEGRFKGMPVERVINLVIVEKNHGIGIDITKADHTYHISLNH